jgi:hypothetical protein
MEAFRDAESQDILQANCRHDAILHPRRPVHQADRAARPFSLVSKRPQAPVGPSVLARIILINLIRIWLHAPHGHSDLPAQGLGEVLHLGLNR